MAEIADKLTGELGLAASIVGGLSDGAALVDLDYRTLHYNLAFATLCGLRRRALDDMTQKGTTAFELLGSGVSHDKEHASRCVESRKVLRLDEVQVQNQVGGAFTGIVTFIPVLDLAGKPIAFIYSVRDVSAEARMQSRYKELVAAERARAEDLERQVAERTKELTAALEQVTRLSRTDPLTGLANRRSFAEWAQLALDLAKRHSRSLAVLVCDLDFFKRVNDTLGHDAGDAVLVATANALREAVRNTDQIARFGGEEFVVLLTETDPAAAFEVADRCRKSVGRIMLDSISPAGKGRQTVSIGVALFPIHGDSLRALTTSADKALYVAKESGRDRVIIYDSAFEKHPAEKVPAAEGERK